MTERKWTPGPWRIDSDDCGNVDVISVDDWVVAEKAGNDAHLIAAALDLYEALEDALDWHDGEDNETIAKWRSALAKARGEQ